MLKKLIQQRHREGKIRNPDQARKSLAGNIFQGLVLYALAGMQEEGLIPENVEFSTTKEHPIIKKIRRD